MEVDYPNTVTANKGFIDGGWDHGWLEQRRSEPIILCMHHWQKTALAEDSASKGPKCNRIEVNTSIVGTGTSQKKA